MDAKTVLELQAGLVLAQSAYRLFVDDMKREMTIGSVIAWNDSRNGKKVISHGIVDGFADDYSVWVKVEPSGALHSIPIGHLIPRLVAYSG